MRLPRFFIVERVPVKFVETEDGGMSILRFSGKTGKFELAPNYLSRVYGRGDSVVEMAAKNG